MKKRVLSTSIASALIAGAGTVGAFEVADNGIGLYNLMPYYTAQAGNATLIQVTNTDTSNGKAVKVRFRGAEWSDDVFDFTLFLSPGDVWTGAVTANGDIAAMETEDESCTLPASVDQNFVTSRLEASDSANAGTLEGYMEVITMADIPKPLSIDTNGDGTPDTPYDDASADDQAQTLYGAIKHIDGVPPCTSDVLTGLQPDHPWIGSAPGNDEMENPTGSLMSFAININVPTSKAFANEAIALNPISGVGNKIFFRQSNQTLPADPRWTADRIFYPVGDQNNNGIADQILEYGTGLQMFQFDMPDLTTPINFAALGSASNAAFLQRDLVTQALQRDNAVVEYVTDPALEATTDVVFNQPTRRFYYVYDNFCGEPSEPAEADKPSLCAYEINSEFVDIEGEPGTVYASLDGENNLIGVGDPDFWDREEDNFEDPSDIVISPTPPSEVDPINLVGEVSVVSINAGPLPTGSLNASLTAFNYESPLNGPDGWVALSTTGDDGPLPVIGFTAIKLFNAGVGAAGTNYGMALPLRTPD